MDCRHHWLARLAFATLPGMALSVVSGCLHTQEIVQPVMEAIPANAKIEKVEKKKEFTPAGLVSIGNYRAHIARGPELSSTARDAYRDEARKSYQRALQLDPKFLNAYLGLADLYEDLEDYERCRATYREGLKALPKAHQLWYRFGMCQAKHKDWDKAIASLSSAHELEPENRSYINAVGFTMAHAGRVDESYAFFEKKMGPARAHYNLARLLGYLGQPEQAREHLLLALQAKPGMEEALQALSDLNSPATPPTEGRDAQLSFDGMDQALQSSN